MADEPKHGGAERPTSGPIPFRLNSDGSLTPVVGSNSSAGAHWFRRAADPRSMWGFAWRVVEKWGFPALMLFGAAWLIHYLVVSNRADQRAFLTALRENTAAIGAVVVEQREANTLLERIDRRLDDHLQIEERRRR